MTDETIAPEAPTADEAQITEPTDTPVGETPTDETEGEQAPEPNPPVTLTLSNGAKTVEVRVPAEVAQAVMEYGAPAVLYMAGAGPDDPDKQEDQFARARQHALNAVHELQNASLAHPLLTDGGDLPAHAQRVALQAVALVYNMLAQFGMAERAQMKAMADAMAAQQTVSGETQIADLPRDGSGGVILGG